MRYLTSISLALVVHVLLSIGILMALACTAEPATPAAAPTPSGPMYSEEEAIAILKDHLQTKIFPGDGYPCLMVVETNPVTWSAEYSNAGYRWDINAKTTAWSQSNNSPAQPITYTWSVYERTKSIVATGDDPVNQVC